MLENHNNKKDFKKSFLTKKIFLNVLRTPIIVTLKVVFSPQDRWVIFI